MPAIEKMENLVRWPLSVVGFILSISRMLSVTRQLVIDFSISLAAEVATLVGFPIGGNAGKKTVEFERLRHYASCSVLNTIISSPPYVLYTHAYHIGNIHYSNRKTGEKVKGLSSVARGSERLLRPLRPTGCRRRRNEVEDTHDERNILSIIP